MTKKYLIVDEEDKSRKSYSLPRVLFVILFGCIIGFGNIYVPFTNIFNSTYLPVIVGTLSVASLVKRGTVNVVMGKGFKNEGENLIKLFFVTYISDYKRTKWCVENCSLNCIEWDFSVKDLEHCGKKGFNDIKIPKELRNGLLTTYKEEESIKNLSMSGDKDIEKYLNMRKQIVDNFREIEVVRDKEYYDFEEFTRKANIIFKEKGKPVSFERNYSYIKHIYKESKKYDVLPIAIIANIKTESNFNVDAKASNTTAFGLMQIVEGTAKDLNINRKDVYQNITGGIKLISELRKENKDYLRGYLCGRSNQRKGQCIVEGNNLEKYYVQHKERYEKYFIEYKRVMESIWENKA